MDSGRMLISRTSFPLWHSSETPQRADFTGVHTLAHPLPRTPSTHLLNGRDGLCAQLLERGLQLLVVRAAGLGHNFFLAARLALHAKTERHGDKVSTAARAAAPGLAAAGRCNRPNERAISHCFALKIFICRPLPPPSAGQPLCCPSPGLAHAQRPGLAARRERPLTAPRAGSAHLFPRVSLLSPRSACGLRQRTLPPMRTCALSFSSASSLSLADCSMADDVFVKKSEGEGKCGASAWLSAAAKLQ